MHKPRLRLKPLLLLLAAGAATVFAFLVEYRGGAGPIPTWDGLYAAFGLPVEAPAVQAGDGTSVSFLDVGQGDAVLVRQGEAFCLIDTGTPEAADDLVVMLRAAGVETLDLLALTHPHADHMGGMTAVLDNFDVDTVLLPDLRGADAETGTLGRIMRQLADGDAAVETAVTGAVYPVGQGTLTVLSAGYTPDGAEEGDDAGNDASLCLLFDDGALRFLDTGDAEAGAEQALADAWGASLRCTVFKAGHHGSSTSNTDALLAMARPKIAVVSCGLDNDYGHPSPAALERFAAHGVEVYRTDLLGTVTVSLAGETPVVEYTGAAAA